MKPNFFETETGTIAWYTTGSGKPLLHLHGWGSDSKVMMPMANRLEDIRKSYLIDFPGFGQSPQPVNDWRVDDYADIVETFISEMIPEKKIDLFVHSFGARVAIKLLTRPSFSSMIDKVVFTGGAGLKPSRSASYYAKMYTAKILKLPFNVLPENLRENGLKRLRESSIWKRLGSSDYQKLSGVMRQTFVNCVNEHLNTQIPLIDHEILLIWGENDMATPVEQAHQFENLLKESALIVINDAGHYAFLDKPKQFSSILQAYFDPDKSA